MQLRFAAAIIKLLGYVYIKVMTHDVSAKLLKMQSCYFTVDPGHMTHLKANPLHSTPPASWGG